MKIIRYIGNKPVKTDNVAKTGKEWLGNGAVQSVSDEAAAKLLAYPEIFELVGESNDDNGPPNSITPLTTPLTDTPKVDSSQTSQQTDTPKIEAPMVSIETMDGKALRDYAQRYFGHTFHHATGEAKMRQEIVSLMNKG